MRKQILWTVALGLCLLAMGAWAQDRGASLTRDNGTPQHVRETTIPGLKSLTTTFVSNNGQDGNMFDVKAETAITIQGFDINICDETPTLVEVYYKVGTSVGFDHNPSAWTLLGNATVYPAGSDVPTPLPVGGLTIPAGATYGLYLTTTGGACGFNYTDGTTDYSNSDLTIYHGFGKSYPFGDTYEPRIWNGTIYYTLGGSAYDLSYLDDFGRSQVCVNSKTGAWQYAVLSGFWKGVYTGKASISKTSDRWTFRSVAGSPRLMLLTVYPQMFRATASLGGSDFVSQLSDRNTKDDPPGCPAK